jgi:hypothetical protein
MRRIRLGECVDGALASYPPLSLNFFSWDAARAGTQVPCPDQGCEGWWWQGTGVNPKWTLLSPAVCVCVCVCVYSCRWHVVCDGLTCLLQAIACGPPSSTHPSPHLCPTRPSPHLCPTHHSSHLCRACELRTALRSSLRPWRRAAVRLCLPSATVPSSLSGTSDMHEIQQHQLT